MLKKIYKAVIFDLDGTLLDTLLDIETAMHKVLAIHTLPDPYTTSDFKKMVGWGAKDLLRRAVPVSWQTTEQLDILTGELIKEYMKEPFSATVAYPGVSELLTALEQQAIPKAILSNKPHELVLTIVSHCLGEWHFEAVQGAVSTLPHKPAPEAALYLARQLQCNDSDTVFTGDSGVDMETAVNAGMFPAGVLWGYQTKDELIQAGARVLLQTPIELLALFE